MSRQLPIAAARALGASLLQAAGVPSDLSDQVSEHLTLSDASGYASHGLSLLPLYITEFRAGRIAAANRGQWLQESGSVLIIDGERGFGAPIAQAALARGTGCTDPAHGYA